MITFVVTTYNLEEWLLRRCLHSIVTQGLARDAYEIIVVDDESAVSPQSVVDEFVEQANITLYVQKHARQGAARNLALSQAKGEWIQFVDGDDFLFDGTIVPLLRSAEANDLDLLMFAFREVHDSAAENISADNYSAEKSSENNCHLSLVTCQLKIISGDTYMSCNNLFGVCWRQMFKRQILDDPIFGESLRFTEGIYIEDEEFVTKLVWRARRMTYIDVPVYAYYQRAGSTVRNRSSEHTGGLFADYFVVLKRLLDFKESLGAQPHDGVTRKVRFLALDILRRVLRESDWEERWDEAVHQLRSLGMYPLPVASYSWKYRIFRLLAHRGIGCHILRMIEKGR